MNKESVKLDKKLQMYVSTMALKKMPFGREWDSSAKKLQDTLLARGIKLPKKIFYEYKMPFNITQKDFMDKIIMDHFCAYFFGQYGYSKDILKDKKLTIVEKARIFKYVLFNRVKYKNILNQYESEIRKNNSELTNVRVDNPRSLVYGAMFGFAPEEIAYYADINNRDIEQEAKVMEVFNKKYGINVTYILAPDTVKKIITALDNCPQHNSKER